MTVSLFPQKQTEYINCIIQNKFKQTDFFQAFSAQQAYIRDVFEK